MAIAVRLRLFRLTGTVFVFRELEGLIESDHVFARTQGIKYLGFLAERFLAVVGGFDRETDATLGFVHLDNAGFDFLADFENVFDFLHTIFADLRDVHEAVDVVLELDKCTEVGEFADSSLDEIANAETAVDFFPRIGIELFDTKADALVGFVDVENHGFEIVALFEHFARVIDLAGPGEIRDVDHAVDAFFEFDECTVGGHVANLALDLFADHVAKLDLVPWIWFELANAEGDLLLVLVDAEHEGFDFLAECEDIRWTRDALGPGEFRHVDETFDAVFDLNECAVGHEVRDFAGHLLTNREALFDLVPWVRLHLLEAEGDALLVLVDVENLNGELLTDLDEFGRVVEACPGHVGDMQEAVDAVEVDECTEVGDVFDCADDFIADGDSAEEGLAFLRAFLLDDFAAAENDIFAVFVDFDDLEIVGISNELLEVLWRHDVDLGCGEECLHAHVDGEAAFDGAADFAFDEAVALENSDDFFPILALGCLLFGENDHALVIFEAFEENFDFVAEFNGFGFVEFRGGDHAFAFVSDIHEEFPWSDLKDVALDDATFAVVFDRVGDQFLQC